MASPAVFFRRRLDGVLVIGTEFARPIAGLGFDEQGVDRGFVDVGDRVDHLGRADIRQTHGKVIFLLGDDIGDRAIQYGMGP